MFPTQAKLAFEKRAKKRAQREAQAQAEAQIAKPGSCSTACGAVLATVSESSTITPSEPSDLSAAVSRSSVPSTSSPPSSQTLCFTNYARNGIAGEVSVTDMMEQPTALHTVRLVARPPLTLLFQNNLYHAQPHQNQCLLTTSDYAEPAKLFDAAI